MHEILIGETDPSFKVVRGGTKRKTKQERSQHHLQSSAKWEAQGARHSPFGWIKADVNQGERKIKHYAGAKQVKAETKS